MMVQLALVRERADKKVIIPKIGFYEIKKERDTHERTHNKTKVRRK